MANQAIDLTEVEEAELIDDPVLWAETYLQNPVNPNEPLRLRWYQKNILRDNSQRRVLRMGRRCVASTDTIHTPVGMFTFEDLLIHHPPIWTLDTDTYILKETTNYDVSANGVVDTVKLTTVSDKHQQVSLDHPFLVYTESGPEWVEAQDIEPGMRICIKANTMITALSSNVLWEPVKSVVPMGKSQTIDLHVPDTETFVGNDIISHNTGKTATLAVIALFNAYTYAHRQVLVVAAYESQTQEVFEQMIRMGESSPMFKPSIIRTRQRPFEIWLSNGSLIRGMVANNTVRSKCLPSGTQILCENNTFKKIEDLEPGELVASLDESTGKTQYKPIVNVHNNGMQPVLEVITTSGRVIRSTANHKFYRNGYGWQELETFDTVEESPETAEYIGLLTLSSGLRWGRVATMSHVGILPVWDLEIEDNHNFVAFWPETDTGKSSFAVSGLIDGGFLVHNSAHILIMDETDYMDDVALVEAVWPVANTFRDTEVVMSSTPSGRREFFWKVCNDLKKHKFVEHFYPSSYSPEWTKDAENFARSTSTQSQYEREYEAKFGQNVEGVFRHKDVDASLYAYSYEELEYNPDHYYTLGVDWNEAANGVQILVLEWLKTPTEMYKYSSKEDTVSQEKEVVMNKWRVFHTEMVDALDFTNITAVDTILDVLMRVGVHYACFDRGHGYTNYELLRLAIDTGITASGKKVRGLKHLLENMESVNFADPYEVIDPVINTVVKSKTKNVIVRNAAKQVESHLICIPAVKWEKNKDGKIVPGDIVENNKDLLVGQMRDYRVERVGDSGEIYSKGNDHRLDAFMLALHGYLVNEDLLMHWSIATNAAMANNNMLPAAVQVRLREAAAGGYAPTIKGTSHTQDGVMVNRFGHYAGSGEPPDAEDVRDNNKHKITHSSRAKIRGRKSRSL